MTSPLDTERERASFSTRELTIYLAGGEDALRMRERFEAIVESDPVFARSPSDYNLSRPERYALAMRKQRRLLELEAELGIQTNEGLMGGDERRALRNEKF